MLGSRDIHPKENIRYGVLVDVFREDECGACVYVSFHASPVKSGAREGD